MIIIFKRIKEGKETAGSSTIVFICEHHFVHQKTEGRAESPVLKKSHYMVHEKSSFVWSE